MSLPASKPPFTIQRIDHVVLRVQDLTRSTEFYTTVLGCSIVRIREELGLVHLSAGTSLIDLISVQGALGRSGGPLVQGNSKNVDHFCLRIEPFDESALIRHLSAHGLAPRETAKNRFGAEGTGLSIYFSDPDGNFVELKGPSTSP